MPKIMTEAELKGFVERATAKMLVAMMQQAPRVKKAIDATPRGEWSDAITEMECELAELLRDVVHVADLTPADLGVKGDDVPRR